MPTKRQVDFADAGPSTKPIQQPKRKRARVEASADKKETEAKSKNTTKIPKNTDTFYLVAGSYERILYGLQITVGRKDAKVEPIFSFPAHQACIKAAAAGQGTSVRRLWLATASTDDNLKLWDLSRRKELGTINAHEAAVTSIHFVRDSKDPSKPASKYLLTTSNDRTLNLFRTKDWALVRTFKGHKGRVIDVGVHPMGRIAISVGSDRTMRMWDLLGNQGQAMGGGKQGSNSTSLGIQGELVRWNENGDKFAVLCDRELRLYRVDMHNIKTLTSKSRFHDVQFYSTPNAELIFVACEDGKVRVYQLIHPDGKGKQKATEGKDEESDLLPVAELVGHEKRVKSVQIIQLDTRHVAATISSDGFMHVYDLEGMAAVSANDSKTLEPIAKHSTKGSRLTCLATIIAQPDALEAIRNVKSQANGLEADSDSNSDSEEDQDRDSDEEDEEDSLESSLSDEDDLDSDELQAALEEVGRTSSEESSDDEIKGAMDGRNIASDGAISAQVSEGEDDGEWTGIADE